MIARPPTLRMITIAFWATGVGRAIYDGTIPSMWFWVTVQLDPAAVIGWEYPLISVLWNVMTISLTTVGFYAILMWLPVRFGFRVGIATFVGGTASQIVLRHPSMDGPGYLYTNGYYLIQVFLSLLIVSIFLLGRYLLHWSQRHRSLRAA